MAVCCSAGKLDKRKRLVIMFLMTGSFMVTEMVVGYCGDSLTLVADSFHMLNDVAALVVAFVTSKLSTKSWERCTFGWARADVLGAMINCVFLLALAFSILVEAMKRFVHPEPVVEPRWVFSVGVCGLVINLIGLFLFKDHAHSHGGSSIAHAHDVDKSQQDPVTQVIIVPPAVPPVLKSEMNMRGVFLHVLADTMASVVVLISAAIVWGTEDKRKQDADCWAIIDYIDPALSIIIVFLIFVSTLPLLYQASIILLQALPSNLKVDIIRNELGAIEGVVGIDELHIWQLTGAKVIASAHLRCIDLKEYGRISKEADQIFRKYDIHSTTIQGKLVAATERLNNNWKSDCDTANLPQHAPKIIIS